MNITLYRYMHEVMHSSINEGRYWLRLTLLLLDVWSRSYDISTFCMEKYMQSEMLVSSKATTLRM